MLSDANREAGRAFDVLVPDKGGIRDVHNRCVFIIDQQGTIRYNWQAEPREQPDITAVLAALDALDAGA